MIRFRDFESTVMSKINQSYLNLNILTKKMDDVAQMICIEDDTVFQQLVRGVQADSILERQFIDRLTNGALQRRYFSGLAVFNNVLFESEGVGQGTSLRLVFELNRMFEGLLVKSESDEGNVLNVEFFVKRVRAALSGAKFNSRPIQIDVRNQESRRTFQLPLVMEDVAAKRQLEPEALDEVLMPDINDVLRINSSEVLLKEDGNHLLEQPGSPKSDGS